jgi:hypothetical protein
MDNPERYGCTLRDHPVVGLLITVTILAVLRQAAREVYRRLMDAVDPALIHAIPPLSAALVQADPKSHDGLDHHAPLASHR